MAKHRKQMSKHSVTRAKQRLGHTKHGISESANRAFATGLRAKQTKGALHDMLTSYVGKTVVYYANAIYIFGHGDVLITVLDKDTNFDRDLYKYVDYPTYMFYKQNRYKYQKDRTKLRQDLAIGNSYYISQINEILLPCSTSINSIYSMIGGGYEIKVNPENLSGEIVNQIISEFGVAVTFCTETESVTAKEIKELKRQMVSWFTHRGIISQIKSLNSNTARLKVYSDADKLKVENQLAADFEKEFGYKIIAEVKIWDTNK